MLQSGSTEFTRVKRKMPRKAMFIWSCPLHAYLRHASHLAMSIPPRFLHADLEAPGERRRGDGACMDLSTLATVCMYCTCLDASGPGQVWMRKGQRQCSRSFHGDSEPCGRWGHSVHQQYWIHVAPVKFQCLSNELDVFVEMRSRWHRGEVEFQSCTRSGSVSNEVMLDYLFWD